MIIDKNYSCLNFEYHTSFAMMEDIKDIHGVLSSTDTISFYPGWTLPFLAECQVFS